MVLSGAGSWEVRCTARSLPSRWNSSTTAVEEHALVPGCKKTWKSGDDRAGVDPHGIQGSAAGRKRMGWCRAREKADWRVLSKHRRGERRGRRWREQSPRPAAAATKLSAPPTPPPHFKPSRIHMPREREQRGATGPASRRTSYLQSLVLDYSRHSSHC